MKEEYTRAGIWFGVILGIIFSAFLLQKALGLESKYKYYNSPTILQDHGVESIVGLNKEDAELQENRNKLITRAIEEERERSNVLAKMAFANSYENDILLGGLGFLITILKWAALILIVTVQADCVRKYNTYKMLIISSLFAICALVLHWLAYSMNWFLPAGGGGICVGCWENLIYIIFVGVVITNIFLMHASIKKKLKNEAELII